MRKFILFLLLLGGTALAETQQVYLGLIPLAGLVPPSLPSEGTSLQLVALDQPLLDMGQSPIGFIPIRFREAISRMQAAGLEIHFDVEQLNENPLPGKFMLVEVWVETDDLERISPLIYSIPVHVPPELAGLTD